MARFYGTIQGERGEATRLGRRSLDVTAQSYAGDITVELYGDDADTDCCRIRARSHDQRSLGFCLYDGPISDLLKKDARHARIQALGLDEFVREFEAAE